MFCQNCGAENNDQAINCVKCNKPLKQAVAGPSTHEVTQQIPSHLVLAIVSLFFVWITAIPAIIYASRVSGLVLSGNIEEAKSASKKAKIWSWVGIGLGVAVIVLYIFIIIVGAVVSVNSPT